MSEGLVYLLLLIPSMVLHELAHGYAAHLLGDDTAKNAGRLTLNPLKHIDPMGSVLVPLGLAAGQLASLGHVDFLYGWAKPVPVNTLNLQYHERKNPRRLMAVVAAAGPAMNFGLALLGGLVLHAVNAAETAGLNIQLPVYSLDLNIQVFVYLNLLIGIFNLIPLPPMDGGRIAVGVLPLRLAMGLAKAERLGIGLVLLVLFVLPAALAQFGIAFQPFQDAMARILPSVAGMVFTLTGNHVGN